MIKTSLKELLLVIQSVLLKVGGNDLLRREIITKDQNGFLKSISQDLFDYNQKNKTVKLSDLREYSRSSVSTILHLKNLLGMLADFFGININYFTSNGDLKVSAEPHMAASNRLTIALWSNKEGHIDLEKSVRQSANADSDSDPLGLLDSDGDQGKASIIEELEVSSDSENTNEKSAVEKMKRQIKSTEIASPDSDEKVNDKSKIKESSSTPEDQKVMASTSQVCGKVSLDETQTNKRKRKKRPTKSREYVEDSSSSDGDANSTKRSKVQDSTSVQQKQKSLSETSSDSEDDSVQRPRKDSSTTDSEDSKKEDNSGCIDLDKAAEYLNKMMQEENACIEKRIKDTDYKQLAEEEHQYLVQSKKITVDIFNWLSKLHSNLLANTPSCSKEVLCRVHCLTTKALKTKSPLGRPQGRTSKKTQENNNFL